MRCTVTDQALQRWVDGEAGSGGDISEHVEGCEHCANRLQAWERASNQLRDIVDQGVGEVEPLLALRDIRLRITEYEHGTLTARLRRVWQDLWAFNRRAVAGVAMAAALGAVAGPGIILWAEQSEVAPRRDMELASVVVEELVFDGHSRAVVYRPSGGNTTIIWVDDEGSNVLEEF